MQGWEVKLLSQAGREILIKAVAQALPAYTMSCFKLPMNLCHEIEALIRKFYWGQHGDARKIHWVKWQEMCKPKSQGGMGFKDLSRFNDAFLAKHTWRLLHDHHSLFYRVFKARFFPDCSIMEAKESSNASFAWKSILRGRDVIKRGAVWRIRNGKSVHIWGDRWLLGAVNNKVISPAVVANTSTLVSSLIDQTNRVWKGEIIESYFFEWEAKIIKNIPLCRSIQEDVLIWPFSPDGEYTVQTGYRFLQKQHMDNEPGSSEDAVLKSLWKKIWGLKVPEKVRNLVWRACKNALPTKMNLLHRKVVTSAVCELCNLQTEDPAHALYHCPKLETLWQSTPLWGHSTIKQCSSFLDIMFVVCADGRDPELFSVMAWTLWNKRNNLRLGKPYIPLEQVLNRARELKLGCLSAPTSATTAPKQPATAWTPPPVHGYKVNFDGALFEQEDRAGLGVVIRN